MDEIYHWTAHLIPVSSFIGSVAFAINGFLVGMRHRLDIVGLMILAFMTANGGGVIRDIILGQTPKIMLGDSLSPLSNDFAYILVLLVSLLTLAISRLSISWHRWRHLLVISDAVGLVAFSFTGALIALAHELNFFGVITLAFINAVGGGIVRDVLINEQPALLKTGCYGLMTAIIGCSIYFLPSTWLQNGFYSLLLFMSFVALQLVSHYGNCHLPILRKPTAK